MEAAHRDRRREWRLALPLCGALVLAAVTTWQSGSAAEEGASSTLTPTSLVRTAATTALSNGGDRGARDTRPSSPHVWYPSSARWFAYQGRFNKSGDVTNFDNAGTRITFSAHGAAVASLKFSQFVADEWQPNFFVVEVDDVMQLPERDEHCVMCTFNTATRGSSIFEVRTRSERRAEHRRSERRGGGGGGGTHVLRFRIYVGIT